MFRHYLLLRPSVFRPLRLLLLLSLPRVAYYGNHFWLMYDGDKLISFVDGFVTDDADLTDEMCENAAMHNENGA